MVVRSEEWEEHRALLYGYRPSVLQDRKSSESNCANGYTIDIYFISLN